MKSKRGAMTRFAGLAALALLLIAAGGQGYATASSELTPGKTNTYVAGNVFDLDTTTAWVEGVDGDGVGEWVALELGEADELGSFERLKVQIAAGYHKTTDVLDNNGIPTRIRVELYRDSELIGQSTASPGQTYEHVYDTDLTGLKPGSGPLRLKLIIQAVQPGKKFHDTAISEVFPEFVGADPHQARDAAQRFCRAVLKRDAAGLKEFTSRPASEVVGEFTNEFTDEVGCEPKPKVRTSRTFDLDGAEGGDGGTLCRFEFDGAKWRLGRCNYISYL